MLWFLEIQVLIDSFVNSFIYFFKNLYNFHPAFRRSGVPAFHSSSVPQFRRSTVPAFRRSGIPAFRVLVQTCGDLKGFYLLHLHIPSISTKLGVLQILR